MTKDPKKQKELVELMFNNMLQNGYQKAIEAGVDAWELPKSSEPKTTNK